MDQQENRLVWHSYTLFMFKFAENIIKHTRKLAKEHCYGCEVDHPSQRHHTCIMWTDEEHLNLYFDEAFDSMKTETITAQWKEEIEHLNIPELLMTRLFSFLEKEAPSREAIQVMAKRMRALEEHNERSTQGPRKIYYQFSQGGADVGPDKLYRILKSKGITIDLTSSYNATPHRTLNNIAPKDVNTNNEADIWAHMYLKPKTSNKGLKPYHFKINDLVRIASKNSTFERSYDEHFTREIFKVRKCFRMQGIPMYRLKSFLDAAGAAGFIRGNFYENEMQKVHKNEDSLWYIEKKIRKRKRKGITEWLVKLEGWPKEYNQWVAEQDITDKADS
ncbi:unnamed protein product [Mytilus coruscus]|uniref:Chromo domain-containing protein n=1 Tax=Mytilus coruscus TaxID=42192 RepID=A0A6J8F0R0_MYTCO|nr:unnamed protein product [Mytilus coruscus]